MNVHTMSATVLIYLLTFHYVQMTLKVINSQVRNLTNSNNKHVNSNNKHKVIKTGTMEI